MMWYVDQDEATGKWVVWNRKIEAYPPLFNTRDEAIEYAKTLTSLKRANRVST